ncbi:hypothetical protein C8R47DRAFT_581856 [Mycena vitilis]|nr:hypothetical protein C8R47DRAFT_581856 [Mycena vitilis]
MSSQTPYYPPPPGNPSPSYLYSPTHNKQSSISVTTGGNGVYGTNRSHTPSPTLSEYNALNGIKEEKSFKNKLLLYGLGAVVLASVVLVSVFHEKIINGLSPLTDWMRDHSVGPVIAIAVLIIMSFPPLFGHELVEMLVGVTYDLAPAFGIVAAGVLLGEIACFFVFKFCCTGRSKKEEKSKLSFALMAHVVRTGGFLVVIMIRYSAIPPHFATAVFATVGLEFWVFFAACVLSLPKAFAPVYIGWALRPENDNNSTSNKVEKIIMVISVLITLFAFRWIKAKMEGAKPDVIYARRKARQPNF